MYPFYTSSRSNNLGIGTTNTPRRLITQPTLSKSNTNRNQSNTNTNKNNQSNTNRNTLLERLNSEKKLLQHKSGHKIHSTQSDRNREYMQKVLTFQQKLRHRPYSNNSTGCASCSK